MIQLKKQIRKALLSDCREKDKEETKRRIKENNLKDMPINMKFRCYSKDVEVNLLKTNRSEV